MSEQSRGRTVKWLRVAFGVGLIVANYALSDGSAKAASLDLPRGDAARVATVSDASGAGEVVLAGFTAQHYPVWFRVSSDHRKVLAAAIGLNLTCTSGGRGAVPDAFANVRIKPSGRLRGSFTSRPTVESDGSTVSGTDLLMARLGPRHSNITGTWRLQLHITRPGGESDLCDSGPVRFTAST